MYGHDTYVFVEGSTKAAGFDYMLLIGPLLVAIVSILTMWLTNKNNFKNNLVQHQRQLEKEQTQREFDLKKEIYQPIAAAFLEMQQAIAKTLGGEMTMARVQEMGERIGRAVGAAQLVAKPETFVLIQSFHLLSAKRLFAEMPGNDKIAREKADIEAMPNGREKGAAYLAFANTLVLNMPRIAEINGEMIREVTPVIVALRNELGIHTDEAAAAALMEELVAVGLVFLDEVRRDLEAQLGNNALTRK